MTTGTFAKYYEQLYKNQVLRGKKKRKSRGFWTKYQ